MVLSPFTIPFIITSLVLSVLLPVTLFVYLRLTYRVVIRTVAIGAVAWIVFSQILEKIFHIFVLGHTTILSNPVAYALYGALAAGVFEECGRYIALKYVLPQRRSWIDAVGYGLGHGGIESILLGLSLNLQYLSFADMAQSGTLGQLKGTIAAPTLHLIESSLTGPSYVFLLGGIERVFALAVHIALSIIVVYGLRRNKLRFLRYAILLHAAVDIGPALFQIGALGLIEAEIIVGVFGMLAILFSLRMRHMGRY